MLFSYFNLSRSLDQIGDFRGCGDLFRADHDFVLMITELTSPDLFVVFVDKLAGLIEHALAILAKLSISSHELAFILKAIELDFEDICVKFDGELLSVFLRSCSLHA